MSKCEEILRRIDFREINKKVVAPCRKIESQYRVTYTIPRNVKEFQLECANYWNFLNRNYIGYGDTTFPFEYALSYASNYLDSRFRDDGGFVYAYEECLVHTFDMAKRAITEGYIGEMRSRYVTSVLLSVVNPRDYEEHRKIVIDYINLFNIEVDNRGQVAQMVYNYERIFQNHARRHEQVFREMRRR